MPDLEGDSTQPIDLTMPDINEDGTTPASPGEMNTRYQQLLDNDARLNADIESVASGDGLEDESIHSDKLIDGEGSGVDADFVHGTWGDRILPMVMVSTNANSNGVVHGAAPAGWSVERVGTGHYRVHMPVGSGSILARGFPALRSSSNNAAVRIVCEHFPASEIMDILCYDGNNALVDTHTAVLIVTTVQNAFNL